MVGMTDQPPAPDHTSDPSAAPQPGAARAVLRAIDHRVKPDLKRAVPAVLLTLFCFIAGERLGGVGRGTPAIFQFFGRVIVVRPGYLTVVVIVLAMVFVLSGVVATRSVGNEVARVTHDRAGIAAASAIRLLCIILGYLTVALGLLGLLNVDLGHLLVGGAVTGVVIGIAAQQALGNFFAGLVLLFARPYTPGERVKVRTGAMGGPFEGVIVAAGLLYTTIQTQEGPISMPNSGLLSAAIGPATEPDPDGEEGIPSAGAESKAPLK